MTYYPSVNLNADQATWRNDSCCDLKDKYYRKHKKQYPQIDLTDLQQWLKQNLRITLNLETSSEKTVIIKINPEFSLNKSIFLKFLMAQNISFINLGSVVLIQHHHLLMSYFFSKTLSLQVLHEIVLIQLIPQQPDHQSVVKF